MEGRVWDEHPRFLEAWEETPLVAADPSAEESESHRADKGLFRAVSGPRWTNRLLRTPLPILHRKSLVCLKPFRQMLSI